MDNVMRAINQALAEALGDANTKYNNKYRGTGTYYYKGTIGNKSVCYTRAKTTYNGKWGFWSWIQTKYKNGTIKRTKFAKSATRAKAEARAVKLLDKLRDKYGIKQPIAR